MSGWATLSARVDPSDTKNGALEILFENVSADQADVLFRLLGCSAGRTRAGDYTSLRVEFPLCRSGRAAPVFGLPPLVRHVVMEVDPRLDEHACLVRVPLNGLPPTVAEGWVANFRSVTGLKAFRNFRDLAVIMVPCMSPVQSVRRNSVANVGHTNGVTPLHRDPRPRLAQDVLAR